MRLTSWFACILPCLALGSPAFGQTPAEPPDEPPTEPTPETPPAETPQTPPAAPAVEQETTGEEGMTAEELGLTPEIFTAKLYGFIAANYEQVAKTPTAVDSMGRTVMSSNPAEIDVTNFNVMLQGTIFTKYRYFLNLASPGSGSPSGDEGVGVRNAWVELPLFREYFNFRIGKTYRRFGNFNEALDNVHNYIGIEPPELFDGDHLLLTRTTNLMLHGTFTTVDSAFSYALATGADEREGSQFPIGADLRFEYGTFFRLGTSYYTTGGAAVPSRSVGDGSPAGGVINWMAQDEYSVVGGYSQIQVSGFLLQLEYWQARHDAQRDPAAMFAAWMTAEDAGDPFNPRQVARFFSDPTMPSEDNVVQNVKYKINTGYVRAGYRVPVGDWSLTPYAQFDYYSNPETVNLEDVGGDNEAGLTDDGKFYKSTLGLIIKPVSYVAVKVDGSTHTQKFNDETITYPEIRTSFSFYWEFAGIR